MQNSQSLSLKFVNTLPVKKYEVDYKTVTCLSSQIKSERLHAKTGYFSRYTNSVYIVQRVVICMGKGGGSLKGLNLQGEGVWIKKSSGCNVEEKGYS